MTPNSDDPNTDGGTNESVPDGEVVLHGPEGTSQEIVKVIAHGMSFSGPLPPPDMIERYENVHPGATDRILSIAEKEQNIREKNNTKMFRNDAYRVNGSIVVSLSLVVAACYCAYLGQPGVVLSSEHPEPFPVS
ncbi:MAG: DUF2335 domain-containing protein [Rhodobacteraceae bacterium]|nr:DUF2335 domain-containing protein [Paracoccaceae bacterium]